MEGLDFGKPIISPMKLCNLDHNDDFLIDPFTSNQELSNIEHKGPHN